PAAPGEQQQAVLSVVTAHLPVAAFKHTERAVEIQRPDDDLFRHGPENEALLLPPPVKKLKSGAVNTVSDRPGT
uniref:PSD3 protein n=1 Tax=Macrostomum lignano TaxID=282301 RepID=A0A1I8J8L1_9PLAT